MSKSNRSRAIFSVSARFLMNQGTIRQLREEELTLRRWHGKVLPYNEIVTLTELQPFKRRYKKFAEETKQHPFYKCLDCDHRIETKRLKFRFDRFGLLEFRCKCGWKKYYASYIMSLATPEQKEFFTLQEFVEKILT